MPGQKLKILHLEDLPSDAELVRRVLLKSDLNFDLLLTDNKSGFLDALENFVPDIILSDHSLPSFNSIEAINIVKNKAIKVPFILITATISEEFAVEVMKEGSWDYILKDRLQRLPNAIRNAYDKYLIDMERQNTLAKIITNEAIYKDAERIAQFGTWRADLRTGLTEMSDAAYRVLGYEPGSVVFSDDFFAQILHPDDMLDVQNLIADTIQSSETTEMVFRARGSDGLTRYIRSQFSIERDSLGVATAMVGFNQNITKQREAELKTIESEVKYRHLFENNPMPMWVIDIATFQILDVNGAAINHYGYSRDEFLSMTALQFRPESEQDRFLNLDRTIPYANNNNESWKHIRKDKTIIDVEIFAHAIEYEGKRARLILANDVTELTRIHEQLNKSITELEIAQKSQKSILDALPANIALLDSKGTIIAVNNGWKEFALENRMKSKNYNIGENYLAISENAVGEDMEYGLSISHGIEGVIARRIDHFSMIYPCHSPRIQRWFRAEVAALHDKKEAGAVVMHINITDRKLAEIEANELNQQLSESIRQISDYKAALDQSSIVAITDQHGIITYANDNFCKISKYSHEELIGQNHRLVNSSYHPQSFFKELWDTISHGKIWKGELRNRAKDGSVYWVDTTILPFINEKGKPYQYMSIRSDITERKKAEEQVQQFTQTLEKKVQERTSQLEQSIKELESFSYSVSHDLRAPLRIINGYSRLLLDEYGSTLEPGAIEYIRTVSDNAIQMGQLIEDLLNLSRLGLETIEKTNVDMKMLVEIATYELRNRDKQMPSITIDTLPPAVCSSGLIKQVWINLISNAIKYSGKTKNPVIHIGSYMSESENVYFIKDNGAGFDMKYVHRLFGVFQRLHSKEEFEGTGVGLALVHRIISRHGGRIWAEGKVNEGATFYFSLPK